MPQGRLFAAEIEEAAFLAAEWVKGTKQSTLADRYGSSSARVCAAIGEFVTAVLPAEVIDPVRRSLELFRMNPSLEDRRGLAAKAVAAWVGPVSEPAVRTWSRPAFREIALRHRPIDMGGPRDVWLEFYVPPDPRFDNMAPVLA